MLYIYHPRLCELEFKVISLYFRTVFKGKYLWAFVSCFQDICLLFDIKCVNNGKRSRLIVNGKQFYQSTDTQIAETHIQSNLLFDIKTAPR